MTIEPEVWPESVENVPITLGAVPLAFSATPLLLPGGSDVVTVIESTVRTGPPEKLPVNVLGVPPLVMVRVQDAPLIVIAPDEGRALKLPLPVAVVPLDRKSTRLN